MENLKDPRPTKIKPAISVRLEQHGKQDQWLLFPDFQRQPRKEQFPRPVEAPPSRPVAATGAEYVCHQPWWLPVGAVLHVWSPAEVCEFITLTVSDPPNPNYRPKPQNCLQSSDWRIGLLLGLWLASCSRPSQAPIPLNQDLGDGLGTLQQGDAHFSNFARLLGSLPLIFPFVFFWGGFVHGKPESGGKQNKNCNSKMPSWEPWRAASPSSIPRGPLRALRSRVPRCLGLRLRSRGAWIFELWVFAWHPKSYLCGQTPSLPASHPCIKTQSEISKLSRLSKRRLPWEANLGSLFPLSSWEVRDGGGMRRMVIDSKGNNTLAQQCGRPALREKCPRSEVAMRLTTQQASWRGCTAFRSCMKAKL